MLVVIAVAYVHPLRAYRDAAANVEARRAEVTKLEHGNVVLEKRIEEAGTAEFIERKARRLGYVRPGERLFIVAGAEEWNRARKARAGASLR
ncbi:MAG TPA: septum formation initiator family protein [Gaiella sp.]